MSARKSQTMVLVIAFSLILILALGELRPPSVFAAQPTVIPVAFQADKDSPPPVPPQLSGGQSQVRLAALSTTLSYYFIPGTAFTPDIGNTFYVRQVDGCVNQMPLNSPFTASVYLPAGSEIAAIRLYTYNYEIALTESTAYFVLSNGMGLRASTHSATSLSNIVGYQQYTSTTYNPTIIDNQNYSYEVQWQKTGSVDSPYMGLCGVRVAYYAPTNAIYLPTILR